MVRTVDWNPGFLRFISSVVSKCPCGFGLFQSCFLAVVMKETVVLWFVVFIFLFSKIRDSKRKDNSGL